MKVKKIPLRSCVVTKEVLPKKELLRIVRTKEDGVLIDEVGKVNGRGAYIKKDLNVLEKARKSKILERRLESSISDEVYEQAKKIIENERGD